MGAEPRVTGDRELAPALARLTGGGWPRLAVALACPGAGPARMAFFGAGAGTRFEVGSVTKAMTGMLLANAIERAELTMHSTAGEVLPSLAGSPVASVTVRELCTHTSGLPRLPWTARTAARSAGFALLGLDPYRGISAAEVVALAGRQELRRRGDAAYSNLGAALLGQLLAARAGMDFAALLERRIFAPIGMPGAAVGTPERHAAPGRSAAGLPRRPWIQDGYAPAGGVIATVADLATLADALLGRTAPGWRSMTAIPGTASPGADRRRGMFWVIETLPEGSVMTWHNGATGGYSAFFALFPETRRAVAALAGISRPADLRRIALSLARQAGLLRR